MIFDAGYEPARLAWLLGDLPVQVLGGWAPTGCCGRRRRPAGPDSRPAYAARLRAQALSDAACPGRTCTPHDADLPVRGRRRPRLAPHAPQAEGRRAWAGHQGLPVIGAPSSSSPSAPAARVPKPAWLWTSCPDTDPDEVNHCWQAFLRGLISNIVPVPEAGPRLDQAETARPPRRRPWTWLILACYAQPRPRPRWRPAPALAGPRPARPPHPRTGPAGSGPSTARCPFSQPHETRKPGPSRPPGSKNRHPATRHDVGRPPSRRRAGNHARPGETKCQAKWVTP